jgi:hypothetical protein
MIGFTAFLAKAGKPASKNHPDTSGIANSER